MDPRLPPLPDAATIAALSGTADVLPVVEPPPLPWRDWDEVRRVREDLRLYRTLFLHQPENLTVEERQTLNDLLAGPVGSELRVARTFLEEWFAIWQDAAGQRRTLEQAERHYEIWRTEAEAAKLAPLRQLGSTRASGVDLTSPPKLPRLPPESPNSKFRGVEKAVQFRRNAQRASKLVPHNKVRIAHGKGSLRDTGGLGRHLVRSARDAATYSRAPLCLVALRYSRRLPAR